MLFLSAALSEVSLVLCLYPYRYVPVATNSGVIL